MAEPLLDNTLVVDNKAWECLMVDVLNDISSCLFRAWLFLLCSHLMPSISDTLSRKMLDSHLLLPLA
ncbi:unnamed protein product [Larinioides sclopetarius]|uniref:Uncharacterized protein n=1 Tax=Larinioides sclopetarius TaxID=280406 RepID=A0AAV2AUY8_9ARAC